MNIDETLTRADREAPFKLGAPDDAEPLSRPWRSPLVWCGQQWVEIASETGEVISSGTVGSDREELRP